MANAFIQHNFVLENIYYISQIISLFFLIFGTIFAIYQYMKQRNLKRVEKAAEIASLFQADIVESISYVVLLFRKNDELYRRLLEISTVVQKAKNFDSIELKKYIDEELIKDYLAYIETCIAPEREIRSKIRGYLSDTLNKLEHISINFNTKMASNETVYQSLHQLVFMLMTVSYIYICKVNEDNIDKYYTNYCRLFTNWISIKEKATKRVEKEKIRREKKSGIGIVVPPRT